MYSKVSETPFEGGAPLQNSGFANRCVIDGAHFDDGGICNYGHQQDRTYYVPAAEHNVDLEHPQQPQTPTPQALAPGDMVVCQAKANRCTICGGHFSEGDDICAHGHMIGQTYPRMQH